MTSLSTFSCSFSPSKQSSIYLSGIFNPLFGRIGRAISADVILQLFKAKCMLVLYYGCEVCPLNKPATSSLQDRSCFNGTFQIRSDDVIAECLVMFHCLPVADAISRRRCNFLLKISQSDNFSCQICCSVAPIVL